MVNDVESALAALKPASPPEALRSSVLGAVAAARGRARSGLVLRWAIAALVATLAWAHVHENQTAERMARAAAAASGITVQQPQMGLLARAILNPRMPMPLPQGYPSTRRHVRLLSTGNPLQNPSLDFDARRRPTSPKSGLSGQSGCILQNRRLPTSPLEEATVPRHALALTDASGVEADVGEVGLRGGQRFEAYACVSRAGKGPTNA